MAGHVEHLHYDTASNLHFQLSGSKTWRLFPPHCALAPVSCIDLSYSAPGGGANFSQVDLGIPDFSRLPDLQTTLQQEIRLTVNPGEAIFVPRGWWHQVEGGDNLTASANLFEPSSQVPLSFCLTWHYLRLRAADHTARMRDWVENKLCIEPRAARIAPARNGEMIDVFDFLRTQT